MAVGGALREVEGLGDRAALGKIKIQGRKGRIYKDENRAQSKRSRGWKRRREGKRVLGRGRARAGANIRGTQQNPSAFERAEIQLPSSAAR